MLYLLGFEYLYEYSFYNYYLLFIYFLEKRIIFFGIHSKSPFSLTTSPIIIANYY
jgi:hypothetical protein